MTRHPRLSFLGASALAFVLSGCGGMSAASGSSAPAAAPSAAGSSAPGSRPPVPAANQPRTRAERTSYKETSSQADVVAFIDSLQRLGAPIWVGALATTVE